MMMLVTVFISRMRELVSLMNKLLAALVVTSVTLGSPNVFAGDTNYTDRSGQVTGSSTTYGGQTTYYDRIGSPIGSASSYGGNTTYRDVNGSAIGGSYTATPLPENQPPVPVRPLDRDSWMAK